MNHQFRKERKQVEAEIELAPMIDCIFILLIFFIVTSVFVEDPGIEVQRPNVSGSEIVNRNVVLIAISEENRIYFDGQELGLEQVAYRLKQAVYDPETPLIIRADKNSSHGVFAAVYSEAKKAGIQHVQFSTQKSDLR
jgi:biopolymer transport protein ExbD